jgi:hypothetical protein
LREGLIDAINKLSPALGTRGLFIDFGTQRTIFGTNGTLSYQRKVELDFGFLLA